MEFGLEDIRIALARPPQRIPTTGMRQAAVAVILLPGPEILFIRRAERASDRWSGQIGFPGGHSETHDSTLLDTAIRETHEEVGLELHPDSLIGPLDDVLVYSANNLVLRPFVFSLNHRPEVRPNEEVAAVFTLGLHELTSDTGRGTMELTMHGHPVTLPRVDFQGQRLWGLSLRVVDDLLDRLDSRGAGLHRLALRE